MIYNLLEKSLQATLLEVEETKEAFTMKIQDGKFTDQGFEYPVNLGDQELIVNDYSFEYTYTGTITELKMIINEGSLELNLLQNTQELNKIFILLRRCALKPAQSNVMDIPDQYPDLFQYSSNTQVEFATDNTDDQKKKRVKNEQPRQQATKKKQAKREAEPQGTHFDFQEQFITDKEQVSDKQLNKLNKAVKKDYIVKQLKVDHQDQQVDYQDHQIDHHENFEVRDFQAIKSERDQILDPVLESKIEFVEKAKKRQWSINHYEKLSMMSKTISKRYVYQYLKAMGMDAEQEKAFTRFILPPDPEDESGKSRKKYCLAVVRALME